MRSPFGYQALLLTFGFLVVAIAPPDAAASLTRPPPLEAAEGCEHWTGTSSGNDPSGFVEIVLCPQGDGTVQGLKQYSSLRSGYKLTEIEGVWSKDGLELTLRDVLIIEDRPADGWSFCLVDRYDLVLVAPDQLEGPYIAIDCDSGTYTLTRVPAQ